MPFRGAAKDVDLEENKYGPGRILAPPPRVGESCLVLQHPALFVRYLSTIPRVTVACGFADSEDEVPELAAVAAVGSLSVSPERRAAGVFEDVAFPVPDT